jgi:hypothetical protein
MAANAIAILTNLALTSPKCYVKRESAKFALLP